MEIGIILLRSDLGFEDTALAPTTIRESLAIPLRADRTGRRRGPSPGTQGRGDEIDRAEGPATLHQVAESLSLAMAATAGDDIVAGMTVLAVEPAPDTTRMLVTVAPPKGEALDPAEIVSRLDRAAPRLRAEVARSITRRRAPSLAFRVSLA